MTDLIYDREFSTQDTSSVIEHVYYSTEEKTLVVQLFTTNWHGDATLAAYSDVPEDVFRALEIENSNRVNGNTSASVGRYWNLWIKPYFTGRDTADLELVSVTESAEADLPKLRELVNSTADVFAAPRPFTIHFKTEVTEDDVIDLLVHAADVDAALVVFNKIAELAGWGKTTVKAVTQFFD